MSAAEVTVDDIQTATGGLLALLRCIYEVSTEIQYVHPDGSRDKAAEQLNSLIILARDEAERIDESVGLCITVQKTQRMTGGQRNG
jgi:hypothetical protein